MRFGEHIRRYRKNAGITTQQLARGIDVSRSYVSLIENGKRMPRKTLLKPLAISLGVSLQEIKMLYLQEISEHLTNI